MKIFLTSICVLFFVVKSFSQDTTRYDQLIKGIFVLVDSIGIPHEFKDTTAKYMYKFKIGKLIHGVYNYTYLYIGANENSMRHFNTFLNTGELYYWGVIYTKEWYNGMPIYRHSSSW